MAAGNSVFALMCAGVAFFVIGLTLRVVFTLAYSLANLGKLVNWQPNELEVCAASIFCIKLTP